ncbi:MarR family winged helix-turn-helix transcriptional regulator [Actinophytocola sp.]|uniref:MarR family winged helix-turn-helix transcriptional regulator n=1 Tax=Actinophytocola sp. TaxID=1872138 RepID=UPI002D7F5349|nr:MarR family transcriptional regulator [Actinophytocola sp.]HET9139416.1 MarR family transcriptional regulator [Actinophytocola sp.]
MVAESTQAQVAELSEQELECGRRLAAAMFAMGKQQASIGARISKMGGFDRSAIVLLKNVVALGPTRSSALAAAVHSDPSTISRQVAALVRAGLVERQADQEDGRASLLAATPAGVALLEEQRRRMGTSLARVIQHWDPDDIDRFVELFERFVHDHERYLPTLINECARWARSEGES